MHPDAAQNGRSMLTPPLDRVRVSTDGASESAAQLPHTSPGYEHHDTDRPRHGIQAGAAARQRGQDAVALRAVSLSHAKSEFAHNRPILRPPSLLLHHMPRNARLRMAVSLRCPRAAQIMLRHRLLLPYTGLGRQSSHVAKDLPVKTSHGHRPEHTALAATESDQHISACV